MDIKTNVFLQLIALRKAFFRVFFANSSQTRFTLGVAAIVLCFGFLSASVYNPNYAFINDLASKRVFGTLFGIHGIVQLLSSLLNRGVFPRLLLLIISMNGLILWGILFLSFVVFDPTETYATEYLFIMPVAMETVVFISEMFRRKQFVWLSEGTKR